MAVYSKNVKHRLPHFKFLNVDSRQRDPTVMGAHPVQCDGELGSARSYCSTTLLSESSCQIAHVLWCAWQETCREMVKIESQVVTDGLGLRERSGKKVLMGLEGLSGGSRTVCHRLDYARCTAS